MPPFIRVVAGALTIPGSAVIVGVEWASAHWTVATGLSRNRIRLFDTTYGVSRFNNSASQITVLVVQNTSDRVVYFNAHFFDANGVIQGTHSQNISPYGAAVVNTTTVPGVAGKSGSIIINNDGRYGVLTGKAVSLEPATGFVFDTLMVARGQ